MKKSIIIPLLALGMFSVSNNANAQFGALKKLAKETVNKAKEQVKNTANEAVNSATNTVNDAANSATGTVTGNATSTTTTQAAKQDDPTQFFLGTGNSHTASVAAQVMKEQAEREKIIEEKSKVTTAQAAGLNKWQGDVSLIKKVYDFEVDRIKEKGDTDIERIASAGITDKTWNYSRDKWGNITHRWVEVYYICEMNDGSVKVYFDSVKQQYVGNGYEDVLLRCGVSYRHSLTITDWPNKKK